MAHPTQLLVPLVLPIPLIPLTLLVPFIQLSPLIPLNGSSHSMAHPILPLVPLIPHIPLVHPTNSICPTHPTPSPHPSPQSRGLPHYSHPLSPRVSLTPSALRMLQTYSGGSARTQPGPEPAQPEPPPQPHPSYCHKQPFPFLWSPLCPTPSILHHPGTTPIWVETPPDPSLLHRCRDVWMRLHWQMHPQHQWRDETISYPMPVTRNVSETHRARLTQPCTCTQWGRGPKLS